MTVKKINQSLLFTLIAIALALPYITYMILYNSNNSILIGNSSSVGNLIFAEAIKLTIVVFGSCLIGFYWSKKLGFAGFGRIEDIRYNWIQIIVSGTFIGLLIYLFGDRYFLKVAGGYYPSQLKFAIFIPFYAAFVEETFARFGVMTLLARIFGNKHVANFAAAMIFAVGHVNMFKVAGIIYRLNYLTLGSFILNLGISLFFGYIYWKKGLMTAMAIHFVANLRYLIIALLIA